MCMDCRKTPRVSALLFLLSIVSLVWLYFLSSISSLFLFSHFLFLFFSLFCTSLYSPLLVVQATPAAFLCGLPVIFMPDSLVLGCVFCRENEVESAYRSVDPAPAVPAAPVAVLQQRLMDTSLSLFERYRAMFALRNVGTHDAVLVLSALVLFCLFCLLLFLFVCFSPLPSSVCVVSQHSLLSNFCSARWNGISVPLFPAAMKSLTFVMIAGPC